MSIEITGIEELQAKLQKLETKLDGSGMQKTMEKIGDFIKTDIELSFENEKSPFGQKWKPLSSVTAFMAIGGKKSGFTKNGKRQRKGFLKKWGAHGSKRILVESGKLANKWDFKATNNSVTVFNNSSNDGFPYGLTHQFGTSNAFGKGINIPARPFLPIDESGNLETALNKSIIDELENDIERVFN